MFLVGLGIGLFLGGNLGVMVMAFFKMNKN